MIGVNRLTEAERCRRGSRRKKKKKLPSFFLLFSSFLETTFRLIKASKSSTDTEFRGKEEEFFFRKVSLSFSFSLFLFFSLVALVNHNTHSPH